MPRAGLEYEYDAIGNLTAATDGRGETRFRYDERDFLTMVTYPAGRSLQFTYNDAGRRTKMTYPDGYELNYEYDAAGRLKRLTDAGGSEIIRYQYDSVGRLAREEKRNGTYTTYEYDLDGQVISMVNRGPDDSSQSRFDYTYDLDGRRVSMTTLEGLHQYEYDDSGQLTGVTYPNGRTVTYEYDPARNRMRAIDDGVSTEYTTNDINQYTRVGRVAYTYDLDGNLILKAQDGQLTSYQYDEENRLEVVDTLERSWQYSYDACGNRVASVHNGTGVQYILDPTGAVDVIAEYDQRGSLLSRYVYGLVVSCIS